MLYRNTVMKAMRLFDPDGVAVRSKRKLRGGNILVKYEQL